MKIPANVSQKKVKNVEQALESLKISMYYNLFKIIIFVIIHFLLFFF